MTTDLVYLGVFVAFAVLVGRKAWAFGMAKLDAYRNDIAQELAQAKALREEAQILLADSKRKHREQITDAENRMKEAELEVAALRAVLLQELDEDMNRRVKQAEAYLARQQDLAQARIRQALLDEAVAKTRAALLNTDAHALEAYTAQAVGKIAA